MSLSRITSKPIASLALLLAAAPWCVAEPAPIPIAQEAQAITPIGASNEASFDQRLTALELALATIVSDRPERWSFGPLQSEAEALAKTASSESEKRAIRACSARLERFAQLAERHLAMQRSPITGVAAPVRLTKARSATTQPKPGEEYDAVGVLRPVVSQRENAPSFALVDGQGKLTTLISPSAEIDLEPLVGKRIGVRGTRGYMPEYRRDHLTAVRATPLKTVLK